MEVRRGKKEIVRRIWGPIRERSWGWLKSKPNRWQCPECSKKAQSSTKMDKRLLHKKKEGWMMSKHCTVGQHCAFRNVHCALGRNLVRGDWGVIVKWAHEKINRSRGSKYCKENLESIPQDSKEGDYYLHFYFHNLLIVISLIFTLRYYHIHYFQY